MSRFTPDTLKLGTAVVVLGAACCTGWAGLVAVLASGRLQHAPGFWTDLAVMSFGNLLLTGIVALLAWVLADQSPTAQRVAV
ncbi:hypothetical protein [uncultured Phenylobacterium sp.]|uniref:hypothetical protein n=1 Tax=uncultured Phenylobacterium sp. TaxID=349273 RepID=UPI0025CD96BB|nr:hypothetical protein [uncultured Phenylobacterium sp.]